MVLWRYLGDINMETYSNDYTKSEDIVLWELHEIRHALTIDFKKLTIAEINRNAKKKYEHWKENRATNI